MVSKCKPTRDERVTIKIDRALATAIERSMRAHPEWGVYSISEFVRRAIDREMDYRIRMSDRKVLDVDIIPSSSPSDIRDRGP